MLQSLSSSPTSTTTIFKLSTVVKPIGDSGYRWVGSPDLRNESDAGQCSGDGVFVSASMRLSPSPSDRMVR